MCPPVSLERDWSRAILTKSERVVGHQTYSLSYFSLVTFVASFLSLQNHERDEYIRILFSKLRQSFISAYHLDNRRMAALASCCCRDFACCIRTAGHFCFTFDSLPELGVFAVAVRILEVTGSGCCCCCDAVAVRSSWTVMFCFRLHRLSTSCTLRLCKAASVLSGNSSTKVVVLGAGIAFWCSAMSAKSSCISHLALGSGSIVRPMILHR